MKKIISAFLIACILTGCEDLNTAWKATSDFVKGPVIVQAEETYLETELYSSGSGRCLSEYSYNNLTRYRVVDCPKNLSVPYIVKDVSSVSLERVTGFGNFQAKDLAYDADTARAFYLEMKPADDPLESSRIWAVFTSEELSKGKAPLGFVRKEGVSSLKAKEAQKARQAKERAQKEEADRLKSIAQCRKAYETAQDKSKKIGSDLISLKGRVVDFAQEGVMVLKEGGLDMNLFFAGILDTEKERVFVYTSETDYATNEAFNDGDYLYEKVGNYKYVTVTGGTNSVPAYKATKYKKSEIDPKTYLSDKSLSCCYTKDKVFGIKYVDGIAYCYTEEGKKEEYFLHRSF